MKQNRKNQTYAVLAGAVAVLATQSAVMANFITNGSFETNGGVGELAGGITTLGGWTVQPVIVTSNTPAGSAPFDFVMNSAADSVGVPIVFSPPNLFWWGPHTPSNQGGAVANGFTGSPDGGNFIGVDGGYATAPLSQTLSGLTVGGQYTLSFEWAGSQNAQYFGATSQDWKVTVGTTVVTTTPVAVPSTGFSGWQTYSTTITATSSSEAISFQAQGTPVGIEPIVLLDNVQFNAIPEPTSLGVIVTGAAGLLTRRRKEAR